MNVPKFAPATQTLVLAQDAGGTWTLRAESSIEVDAEVIDRSVK